MEHIVKVIVPLKLGFEPFYKTTKKVQLGDRLLVKISGKEYIGVVSETDAVPDIPADRILPASFPENPLPRITMEELMFWSFIAKYYMCTIGEVYAAAYPQMKTQGEAALEKAKKQKDLRLAKEKEHRQAAIERLQERLSKKEAELQKKHSDAVMQKLTAEKEKILQQLNEKTSPIGEGNSTEETLRTVLPTKDKKALEILRTCATEKPHLIHGGSERNTIVAECVKDTLARGYNVFVAVPEINISKPLMRQLSRKCGDRITVFHSNKSMDERRQAAKQLRSKNEARVYVGTQSAIFLPFSRLGLIVVDSEENASHKAESTPRLNVRDASVMLAKIHQCPVILSSSCPSLESFYNINTGKYAEHFVPDNGLGFEVIDTSAEARKSGMAGCLSYRLLQSLRKHLSEGHKCLILHPWIAENPSQDLMNYAPDIAMDKNIKISGVTTSKSEDLSAYSFIAVLSVDRIGRKTDFRADEKTVQALHRIRSGFNGEMMVQSSIDNANYLNAGPDIIKMMLAERQATMTPPYVRQVVIKLSDYSEKRIEFISKNLYSTLIERGYTAMPPAKTYKGQDEFVPGLRTIIISFNKDAKGNKMKNGMLAVVDEFLKKFKYYGHVTTEVDPL